MIVFNENECVDICCKNTNEYVRLAAADLANDIERISEYSLRPAFVPSPTLRCIVIEQDDNIPLMDTGSEAFKIKRTGSLIYISGGSYLGIMWGIYTFSEKILGIDPCYIFNDMKTEKKKEIIWDETYICGEPEGFGFRGIFINDEDLLCGWRDGGGIRHINWQTDTTTVPASVIDLVVETALRLKLNLIIPATFLNIDNPPEKVIADRVARRGLFISQHHIEPVGVSAYTFKNYCAKFDRVGEFSYIQNPELMQEIWRYYAEKWSGYDNVVWQIGLRGEGDRPVWQEETGLSPQSLAQYGQLISSAMQTQIDIIMEVTGAKAEYFTSTLWMEGSELMEKGLLNIPTETMIIFSDNGPNQMFAPEFYKYGQDNTTKHGIYYHLQYYNLGPHLAPMTGIDKLYHNVKLCHDMGYRSYFIMNCSNVREFVFELKAYAQMVWYLNDFSKEQYIDEYFAVFGKNKDKVKELVRDYYDSIADLDTSMLKYMYGNYFNFDYKHHPDGIKLCPLKDGGVLYKGTLLLRHFKLECNAIPEWELFEQMYKALKKAVVDYKQICAGFESLCCELDDHLELNIRAKWLNYAYTIGCTYNWFVKLYEAKLCYDKSDVNGFVDGINTACKSLYNYLEYRKKAEYGIFKNWYRGDLLNDVRHIMYNTSRLIGHNAE